MHLMVSGLSIARLCTRVGLRLGREAASEEIAGGIFFFMD